MSDLANKIFSRFLLTRVVRNLHGAIDGYGAEVVRNIHDKVDGYGALD